MAPRGTLRLAVGPIGLQLSCADPALRAALRQRYALYGHPAPMRLTVTVEIVPGPARTRPLAPTVEHSDTGAAFADDGFEATVDLAARRAEVLVHGAAGDEEAAEAADEVDYALRAAVAMLALDGSGLLLHAAGVLRRPPSDPDAPPRALAFFGPSGCGKSTLARLADPGSVLSDDLVLLWPGEDGWRAHATPFCNPEGRQVDGKTQAPLAALYRLAHGAEDAIEPLPAATAVAELAASAPVVNGDPHRGAGLLSRCAGLARNVPVSTLDFAPDPAVWRVVDRHAFQDADRSPDQPS